MKTPEIVNAVPEFFNAVLFYLPEGFFFIRVINANTNAATRSRLIIAFVIYQTNLPSTQKIRNNTATMYNSFFIG